MWISKKDWVQLITNGNENRVRAELLDSQLSGTKDSVKQLGALYTKEKEKNALLSARVSELEKGILKLQDELNLARKMAVPLQSLNLADMYDEEDPVKVEEMRARIKAEGADAVLAEAIERK